MKSWRTLTDKKEKWGAGEWNHEPDKAQWINLDAKLDCLIVRNHMGALCGYVGVPKKHPFYQKSYSQVFETPDVEIRVHGGLTFNGLCLEFPNEDEGEGIFHVVEVANKKVWWFGFDCAHCDDMVPGFGWDITPSCAYYRNFEYVARETNSLAVQLNVYS